MYSMKPISCPGCSGKRFQPEGKVWICAECGGYIGEHMYRGDSYSVVLPELHPDPHFPMSEARYFDLSGVGSDGPYRRHGWFDPSTRQIVQVG